MNRLTVKQEKFCQEYIKLQSPSKAYLAAGYKHSGAKNTLHVDSCKLLNNPKIVLRIKELQEKTNKEAVFGIKEIQKFYVDTIKDDEEETKDKLRASELLGKSFGMFTEKHEVKHSGYITILPEKDIDD